MFIATLTVPYLLAPKFCMDEDNVGKSHIIGTLFVASGLITLLQNAVGVRYKPFFKVPIALKQWEKFFQPGNLFFFYRRQRSCRKVNVFTGMCLSVHRSSHVTITHDALDLTVQVPPPLPALPTPPLVSDIWWPSLASCSLENTLLPTATDIWWRLNDVCTWFWPCRNIAESGTSNQWTHLWVMSQ